MSKIHLPVVLLLVLVAVGCGAGGNTVVVGTGTFSSASLKGQYVYQIAGTDLISGAPYREAGVFTADGNGNITTDTDDFCETSCPGPSTNTGSYQILKDGTGTVTFGNSTGSITLAVTMVSTSKLYLIEEDFANAAGIAEKQTSTAAPSGTFSFRQHNVTSLQGAESAVGVFTVSGGSVTGGTVDVNRGGTVDNGTGSPLTITAGSFIAPASNGRGTGSFSDSSGVTSNFIYYMVDASNVRFLSNDSGVIGSGRAEMQTGGPFTAASLANGYAFGSRGDDSFSIAGVNTVGSLTANGNGTITTGTYDSVVDGTSFPNISFSNGSYTMASNGRAPVTLNVSSGGTFQEIFWMVSPARAFFLVASNPTDTGSVEDGTADQQLTTSFSNSSLNGQYAFVMDGFDLNVNPGFTTDVDRVGWIQWDGSGNLKLSEVVSDNGVPQPSGLLPGTYTVSTNGRAAATVNSLSHTPNDVVLYLISPTDAYVLENDTGVEIIGITSKQISP